MKSQPKVTVFISLFNAEKYIGMTIDSVLVQTFSDFQILIVDDCSKDKSVEVVRSYKDPRIRLIVNDKNIGLLKSRNMGLEEAKTEYVAIIDSDDIMYPTRLEKQVSFLDSHQDFSMVGTWTEIIDSNGKKTGVEWKDPIPPEKIPMVLLFHNCFAHSSVMIRMNALQGERYQTDVVEDRDLWIRLSKKSKIWNIPKILTQYRVHQTNRTVGVMGKVSFTTDKIIRRELNYLNIDPTDEELVIHKISYAYNNANIKEFIKKRQDWLLKLLEKNTQTHYFQQKTFEEVLKERWLISCSANAQVGFWVWKTFWKSSLSNRALFAQPKQVIKFFIKCLLKIR